MSLIKSSPRSNSYLSCVFNDESLIESGEGMFRHSLRKALQRNEHNTRYHRLFALVIAMFFSATGCAGPQTQLGSVSPDQIVVEQARQQQFALELAVKQQNRLQNVALPLLRAAVPLCADKVKPVSGFLVANTHGWKKEYYNAALSAGFTDTLSVTNVTPGLPAALAGIQVGDRIVAINGRPIATGSQAT